MTTRGAAADQKTVSHILCQLTWRISVSRIRPWEEKMCQATQAMGFWLWSKNCKRDPNTLIADLILTLSGKCPKGMVVICFNGARLVLGKVSPLFTAIFFLTQVPFLMLFFFNPSHGFIIFYISNTTISTHVYTKQRGYIKAVWTFS